MRKLLFLLALACPVFVFAQGVTTSQPIVISNSLGRPLGGVSVEICNTPSQTNPSCSSPASIFSNSGLSTPITCTGPTTCLTTDALGQVPTFFASPGFYCYTATASYVTDTSCKLIVLFAATGGLGVVTNPVADQTILGDHALNNQGSINGKRIGNVRYADQFSGADWCAKAQAADSDLGATPGEIWLNQNAGISACAGNLALSATHILRVIQAGTYALGTSQITHTNSSGIVTPFAVQQNGSSSGVTFSYTGSGTPIVPATPTALTRDVTLQGFAINVTSSATGCINMQAANSWTLNDIACLNATKAGAIGIWLHSETGTQAGTYFNNFDRIFFQSVDTGIQFSADVHADEPNANHFGFVRCFLCNKAVNIDEGEEEVFEYLAIDSANTCTYGMRDHGHFNQVKYGRFEQGSVGGSCTGLLYDAHDGDAFHGLANRFTGTIVTYANLIQEIDPGPVTIPGTQLNQIDITGGQGMISLLNVTNLGGGAFGLPPNFTLSNSWNMVAAESIGGANDIAREYIGSSVNNTREICIRSGGVDTCNTIFKGNGVNTAVQWNASGGAFQGASVLDLCTTGACRWEISDSSHALYPVVAGDGSVGRSALPVNSVFIGAAATNNIQVIGTATAARTATLPDGNSSTILVASLVTTAAASDNVTIQGMTGSGHCSVTATNASAATNIATTFISAKASNQITVSHAATANMNYDILCSPI